MTKQTGQPERCDPGTNRILAALEKPDYNALMLKAEIVPLKFRKRLYGQDAHVDAVHFTLACMVSLVVANDGTPKMKMATIYKEGVVGASEMLQVQPSMGLNLIQDTGRRRAHQGRCLPKGNRRPLVQIAPAGIPFRLRGSFFRICWACAGQR
ncbi:MAG TPA: hypothetical protein VN924_16595 [Bryobacteraceae bacterium]|nr:hypothetical protein [Bryobacteraceae bacterium]